MNAEFFVFVAYLVFMIGIGVYFFLKSKDGGEKGYFLGGETRYKEQPGANISEKFHILST